MAGEGEKIGGSKEGKKESEVGKKREGVGR